MAFNMITQMLMNQLRVKNPQGYQTVQNLIQNNGDPQAFLHQIMQKATPEQKQQLFKQAKNYGVPNDFLAQIQNMK